MSDPTVIKICLIPVEGWEYNKDVVKVLVVFSFCQV